MKITDMEIRLNDIRLFARHGVLEQERDTGGDFRVSMAVGYDFSRALNTDCVNDTLNYAQLFQVVKSQMDIPSRLIEHVAGRIAKQVLSRWPEAQYVKVDITKVNPPMHADCKGAVVSLRMSR